MRAIRDLIARHKAGEPVGITSVCSAHPLVIEATLRHAKQFHAKFEAKLVAELGADVAATRRVLAHIIERGDGAHARLRLV